MQDNNSIKEVKEEIKIRIDATNNLTFFNKGKAFLGVMITEDLKGCYLEYGEFTPEQLILIEQILVKGLKGLVQEKSKIKN